MKYIKPELSPLVNAIDSIQGMLKPPSHFRDITFPNPLNATVNAYEAYE
jgi:hypothetical protein